tara:strand:+ start:8130 stop:8708 length:579 start_codon:yes stop_codon:yes gene_type:complete
MGNITDYRTITYFDVETTSLDASKGEIIQICIVTEDADGNLDEWSTKIRPRLKPGTYQREALKINNFKPKEYIDAPIFEDVADKIIEKLRWGPIVAHNAQFDISFIESNLDRYTDWKKGSRTDFDDRTYRLGYPVIDTVSLSYLLIDTERQNLMALREHLGIEKDGGHEAVKDVMDCRTVFWACLGKCLENR